MKYSRATLARAYMRLAGQHSPKALAKGFAHILLKQRTKRDADMLSQEIEQLWANEHNTVTATVTSARELPLAAKKHISSYLKQNEDKEHATITYEIDPTFIGGAVIRSATHTYTFSLAEKIKTIV